MNAPASIQVYEGSNVTTVARITLPNGTALDRADVAADPEDTALAIATAITTADAAALTNDGFWAVDSTGYNFRHAASGTNFGEGGRRYRLEYHITTSSYGTVYIVSEVETKPLYSV